MKNIKSKIESRIPHFLFKIILHVYRLIKYPHFPLIKWYYVKRRKQLLIDNVKVTPPKSTSYYDFGLMYKGIYENDERRLVKKYINRNDCVLELGGCLGVVSSVVNRILLNPRNHVTLEANPKIINNLRRTKEDNKCQFGIENKVISNKELNIFNISKNYLGSSLIRNSDTQIKIEGCTIDDLQNKYELKFTTLVMDIEGAELDLFKNFNLSKTSITKIIFETHENFLSKTGVEECYKLLKQQGFQRIESSNKVQVWRL